MSDAQLIGAGTDERDVLAGVEEFHEAVGVLGAVRVRVTLEGRQNCIVGHRCLLTTTFSGLSSGRGGLLPAFVCLGVGALERTLVTG